MEDWSDHLTTIFPEVRLKTFLEMRGADGGPWQRICALPAFWVGLLYDSEALSEASALIGDWTAEERQALRDEVPRSALETRMREHLGATEAISRAGLDRRGKALGLAKSESSFLQTLDEMAATGLTLADELLERYHGPWGGKIDRIFAEYAF